MVKTATFGAGCFWAVEAAFIQIPGVLSTSVGYMGGDFPDPSYLDVLSRITGHAEVVQVVYDRQQLSYETLLAIFWLIHDPTQLNRQGPDRGEQYRSIIFYHNQDQAQMARRSRIALQYSSQLERDIVTQIQPASDYYLASEDHQHYFQKKNKVIPVMLDVQSYLQRNKIED